MKAFKVQIQFEEKEGFSESELKTAIIKNLEEIHLSLLAFTYQKDGYTIESDFIPLRKTCSVCECLIEYKECGAMIPYRQIVLGGIQMLPQEYPCLEIHGIKPSFVEIG